MLHRRHHFERFCFFCCHYLADFLFLFVGTLHSSLRRNIFLSQGCIIFLLRNYNHFVCRVLLKICNLLSWPQVNLLIFDVGRSFNCFILGNKRTFFRLLLVFKIKHRLLSFRIFLLFLFPNNFEQIWRIFLCWKWIIFYRTDQLSVVVPHDRSRFFLRWQFVALDEVITDLWRWRSHFLFLSHKPHCSSIRRTLWFWLAHGCFRNIDWHHFRLFWFFRRNFEAFSLR